VGRVGRDRRVVGCAVAVAVSAVVAGPVAWSPFKTDAAVDVGLSWTEFLAYPTSLVAAAILVAIGRRRTVVVAVGIVLSCGLTLCQPFGLTADPIAPSQVVAARGSHAALVSWFPPLRVHAYRRETNCFMHDGGCWGDTDVMVRSWVIPGLLDDAVDVSAWAEHGAPRLGRTRDGAAAVVVASDEAYVLGYGITSQSGVVYWLIGGGLLALAWVRLHVRAARSEYLAGDAERDGDQVP
jgi:hypothetical protein